MDVKISKEPPLMRDTQEKKAGLVSGILVKLGLSGGATAGGSAGAGLLASKTGLVALVALATATAAGIGLMYLGSVSRAPVAGSRVFSAQGAAQAGDSMASASPASARDNQASADGTSSSLDYFNAANAGAVKDPTQVSGEEVADAAGASEEDAEEVGSGVQAPDNSYGGEGGPGAAARPQMAKAQKTFKGKSLRSSNVQLVAQAGLAGGISGGFDKTYKAPVRAATRSQAKSSARQHAALRAGHRGSSALMQAQNVKKSNTNALIRPGMSSANAGRPYDGAGTSGGSIGAGADAISGQGAGVGGTGVGNSRRFRPNQSLNTRELPEPEKVKKAENQTPYQDTIKKAILAVIAAGALLIIAGMLKKKEDPTRLPGVRILAGLAAAAAGLVVLLGMQVMNQHGQSMQGMMFAGIGGIIMIQAGMMLWDSKADDKAKEDSNALLRDKFKQTQTKLNTMTSERDALIQLGDARTSAQNLRLETINRELPDISKQLEGYQAQIDALPKPAQ